MGSASHAPTTTTTPGQNSLNLHVLDILTSSASEVQQDQHRSPESSANKAVAYDYLRTAQQLEEVKWPTKAKAGAMALIQILQKMSYDSNQLDVPSAASTAQASVGKDAEIEATATNALRQELGIPSNSP